MAAMSGSGLAVFGMFAVLPDVLFMSSLVELVVLLEVVEVDVAFGSVVFVDDVVGVLFAVVFMSVVVWLFGVVE